LLSALVSRHRTCTTAVAALATSSLLLSRTLPPPWVDLTACLAVQTPLLLLLLTKVWWWWSFATLWSKNATPILMGGRGPGLPHQHQQQHRRL